MIKAVVLDIDGVIVGTKKGINFPDPSRKVSKLLRKIHDNGIPVVFLTAKASFAAAENIKRVGIDNPHIADSGAILFNPIREKVFHVKSVKSSDIHQILSSIPDNPLINLFTANGYFVLRKAAEKFPDFVKRYSEFMQRSPVVVDSFDKVIQNEKVIKMNVYVFDNEQKKQLTEIVSKFKAKVAYRWVTNPSLGIVEIMIVTSPGVSKRLGVETLAHDLKVSLNEILGVGDMLPDWDFIEVCGYKATLANGSKDLKDKFNFSDPKQFMGGDVDEDGIIDILKHFKLL